jgi:molybdopterin-guanine dinucleotide biosynthesis protein A
MTLDAAILAGGRARRMGGVQKALIPVEGRPIVVRQIAALAPLVREILLVVAEPAPFAEVRGARVAIDRERDRGPLGGLATALHASTAEALLVVGCDLPFLDGGLLAMVRDFEPEAQAVVPRIGGRAQPLHARYARSILSSVEKRLAEGRPRLLELLDDLEVAWLDEDRLRALDPTLRGLINVNTPEDLAGL